MKWKSIYTNQSVHPGEQPIRVLVQNVIHTFENVYKEFRMEAKTFYDEFGLEQGLPYMLGPNPLISDDDDLLPYIKSDESETTEAENHPDTDERIFSFMKRLELQDHDALRGIPCISYQFRDAVYGIGFDYGDRTGTYRELYRFKV